MTPTLTLICAIPTVPTLIGFVYTMRALVVRSFVRLDGGFV